ncbi:MAG TPA: DUF4932 domain-containing protein [Planctomycetota bacterium]|nr:DUF4932 domain-containing protein [Planctomycetota bacterium]
MNRVVVLVCASGVLLGPLLCGQEAPPAKSLLQVRVDPRVELLSLVFRLAGNPEYNQGRIDAYSKAVDAWFGAAKDHAVIAHAARLRAQRGVSYDAVMGLAVHLDEQFAPLLPLARAERLDHRWPAAEADKFVKELRDFARKAKAAAFFAEQAPLYELARQRLQHVIDENLELGWFDHFFGARPTASFELAIGLLNGGGNFGPSVKLRDGKEQLYCILGAWKTDGDGQPVFDGDYVSTVAHEFCHSYCNALIDAHEKEFEAAGTAIWPFVADVMQQQAYGNWQTMLRESLVRACVVRYQQKTGGEAAAQREIAEQHDRGFEWTGELAGVLADYERQRAEHATLATFMPEVVAFFAGYAPRFAAQMAKMPHVVRMEPQNGASDVDPGLAAIVVTFDRPMLDGAWAVVRVNANFPKTNGKPSYDGSRKVLTIPVALEAGHDYEFWLNRGKYDSFQSADGTKLRPVRVRFRTRAK